MPAQGAGANPSRGLLTDALIYDGAQSWVRIFLEMASDTSRGERGGFRSARPSNDDRPGRRMFCIHSIDADIVGIGVSWRCGIGWCSTAAPGRGGGCVRNFRNVSTQTADAMNAQKTALRLSRSAPQMSLNEVAVAAAVKPRVLVRGLRELSLRGRCNRVVATAARSGSAAGRAAAVTGPWCPPALMRVAALDRSQAVSGAARGNPAAWAGSPVTKSRAVPRAAFIREAMEGTAAVSLWNAHCPAAIITAAIAYRDGRYLVVDNPNCPAEALAGVLADSEDILAWEQASRAEQIPAVMLSALIRHDYWRVHEAALARLLSENAPSTEMLAAAESMVSDSSRSDMRAAAATNPACPPLMLDSLCRDDALEVRAAAAANPGCDPQAMQRMAGSQPSTLRTRVASNPACEPDLLAQLATDRAWSVRRQVAANDRCPPLVLNELAADPDERVRAAAVMNANCAAGTVLTLGGDDSAEVRARVASNPLCGSGTLSLLAADRFKQPRLAAASNSAVSVSVLAALIRDSDPDVRAAARHTARNIVTRHT